MRVALVHDWLTGMRGGEWVLHEIAQLFPDATIFTLIHRRGSVIPELEQHPINTSWLQLASFGGRRWRYLLPVMPAAAEMFTFANAELVISSSHCVAKGVIPPPGAFHLSYIHTPMRYAWDQRHIYLSKISRVLHPILEYRLARLRQWDMVSSARIDRLVANSRLVAWRVQHYWARQAEIIPPPVDTGFFTPSGDRGENLLTVGALVPYKRMEAAMVVAHKLGRPLEIIGTGPMLSQLKRLRRKLGVDARFLGWVSREELREAYRRSAALIVPNIEDFGMTAVESLACGAPVVGVTASGTADIVRSGVEGELAEDLTSEALVDATQRVLDRSWETRALQDRARSFSRDKFRLRFRFLIDRLGFGKALG